MTVRDLFGVESLNPLEALADRLVVEDYDLVRELYARRIAQGLSIEEVAERMGVHPDSVRDFEGYDANPRLSTIRRYALSVGALVEHTVTAVIEEIQDV